MRVYTYIFITFLLLPTICFALTLKEAKSGGHLGETITGYLKPVKKNSSTEVKTLMDNINFKRKAHYQKIAKQNGTPLSAVEKLAGKKAINKTPAGQYVKRADGVWKKK